MLFNSHAFIFGFLPLTLVVYFLLSRRWPQAGIGWLALASLAFYGWWDVRFVALLLASIAFNFSCGLALAGRLAVPVPRRLLLPLGIAVDLALLVYFKYANFFLAQLPGDLPALDVVLPLGISFFTFTQIAFLVDVATKGTREFGLTNYVLFVTYFPHLIAGPVLHHKEMMPQFADPANKRFSPRALAAGLGVFAIGLVKKVVLADSIAPYADAVFAAPASHVVLTMAEAWAGALAYTMQIYFDFSGYSDMAVGLSLMFGIRLPANFNSPYQAANIVEFWRRWHMTLSRFLRDYLYIPLGGNRHGEGRRYGNLVVTMVIGGLWHGANWTFVLWGALHGFYLLVNHAWQRLVPGPARPGAAAVLAARLLTFVAVVVAWVPFRADSLHSAGAILAAMAGMNGLPAGGGLMLNNLVADWRVGIRLLVAMMAIALLLPNTLRLFAAERPTLDGPPPLSGRWQARLGWRPGVAWGACGGLLLAVGVLFLGGDSPFLYFQF
ncbi:MAG TPA: MBOAT family protein [Magnetospirillum sp.]|nr:MBOAT family protein [Magnetospirillum sp.]